VSDYLKQSKEKEMQKITLATLAVIASVTVASATDLPSKAAPAAPVTPAFVQNGYVGLNFGALKGTDRVYSGGAVAGWNASPFLAVEGAYSYNYDDNKTGTPAHNTHTLTTAVLPQYRIPGTDLTPYLLAGAGYRWDSQTADHTVYNIGGGLKYDLTHTMQIDARFSRTTAFDTDKYRGDEDKFTVGLNFKM
jgi:Outer membrane protein beta-barrel domain